MEKNNKNHKTEQSPSDNKKQQLNDDDSRIDVSKSVFQVNREIQAQKQRELEEKQSELLRQHELREKKKKEEYDRRILEEKKELMRLKQGIIEESEKIPMQPEEPEVTKRSLGKRISSFFYLNKWWLIIAAVFLSIGGVIVYSIVSRTTPDVAVMYVQYNYDVGEAPGFQEYILSFTEDFNDDGKTIASVYFLPYSDNSYANYQLGVDGKMSAQFQAGEAVIVFGAEKLSQYLAPEEDFLVNLEEMFPDNPHVDKCRFMLKGTKFAERIGVEEQYITDDLYLAIRKPMKLASVSEKKMQKTYDKDVVVFKKIIEDLSE